jgi:hypothetical protein
MPRLRGDHFVPFQGTGGTGRNPVRGLPRRGPLTKDGVDCTVARQSKTMW